MFDTVPPRKGWWYDVLQFGVKARRINYLFRTNPVAVPVCKVRQMNQRTDVMEGVLRPFWVLPFCRRLKLVTQINHKDHVKIAKVFPRNQEARGLVDARGGRVPGVESAAGGQRAMAAESARCARDAC
jgi:hypothetical protein